jgi:hypothetical protein
MLRGTSRCVAMKWQGWGGKDADPVRGSELSRDLRDSALSKFAGFLAMQKVVGSSPIIRSQKPLETASFLLVACRTPAPRDPTVAMAADSGMRGRPGWRACSPSGRRRRASACSECPRRGSRAQGREEIPTPPSIHRLGGSLGRDSEDDLRGRRSAIVERMTPATFWLCRSRRSPGRNPA